MKNVIITLAISLLLSSCGQIDAVSTPLGVAYASGTATDIIGSTSTPIPTSSHAIIENTPTVVVVRGLVPDELRKYIGLTYPPFPNELSEGSGSLVWDSDYAVSIVSGDQNTMLWLSKLTHYDNDGKPYWEVKDIIKLAKYEGDVVFIPDGCLLNDELDTEILAIGNWDDEVFVSRFIPNEKIQSAWRANVALGIFEALPTEDIECHADNAIRFN